MNYFSSPMSVLLEGIEGIIIGSEGHPPGHVSPYEKWHMRTSAPKQLT